MIHKELANATRMVVTSFLLVFVLTACGAKDESGAQTGASASAAEDIIASNPYVRALPPGQTVTALFVTLNNQSDNEHSLAKAEGTISEAVELHTHKHANGMMEMRQVESISLPPKSTVELKPGGLHIMLIGLKKDLALDEIVDVTLYFEDGSTLAVQAPVKAINPEMSHE